MTIAGLLIGGMLVSSLAGSAGEVGKHYWATSLSHTVESGILRGLREAVARGEMGWLDVDLQHPIPAVKPGVNLIIYHVGGNCYIGSDCGRFPWSAATNDQWGDRERTLDLNDSKTRAIVVADLIEIVQKADKLAPPGSIIGVHVDNVHKLGAEGLAQLFNDYLEAVEAARQEGLISKSRQVGYIAKNNPAGFAEALERKLLHAAPLYQINENARLDQDGTLDRDSRIAQHTGRHYGIPVFLKIFGTDVAFTTQQNGVAAKVYVSPEMTTQMAQMPDISGAAWSPDERNYRPTLFAQGSPVRQVAFPYGNRIKRWSKL